VGWRLVGWRLVGWRLVGWSYVGWSYVGWSYVVALGSMARPTAASVPITRRFPAHQKAKGEHGQASDADGRLRRLSEQTRRRRARSGVERPTFTE
jgi:hypothetical protein